MKKKIAFLLALLILTMSFTGVAPASAAFSADDKYDVLCALGFFDSEAVYGKNSSVTRGEIISALVNSLPDEKRYSIGKNETGFDDIETGDAIAEVAYNARMLGILGSEKELNPYEEATLEDASFMILNLLGYKNAAGGSYSAHASSIGITKSIPTASKFTMGQFVVMLYNALDTEVMQWSEDNGRQTLTTVKGETYLTEILDAGRERGIVKANRFTGIDGGKATGSDTVLISGESYNVGASAAAGFLGHNADFYYRNDADDEKTIVYIKTYNEDSVVEFDADKIRDFSDMTYEYEVGEKLDRTKRASILKSADIVYNGRLIENDFDKFMPDEGHIKLINNDGDNRYETVIITDYEVVVVGNIDKENGVIGNLYYPEKEYSVDLYEKTPHYSVCYADGTVKKFSDIFKYYTIFVAQSMDKELCTIIISDKTIKGAIEGYSDDEITIDGKKYETTDDFAGFNNVGLHSYGTFYCDPRGRIGAYEGLTDRNIKVGYLIRASKVDDGPEENILLLKLFSENGNVEKLYTAEKLYYINGLEYTNAGDPAPSRVKAENVDVVLTALNEAKDSSLGGGQLVLYKQNGQGRVYELEIPAKYTTDIAMAEKLNDYGNFRQISEKMQKINHKTGLFLLKFRIGPDTKVFSIPGDIQNENKFEVFTGTTNCFAWNKEYTVVAYSKNTDSSYADYVLGFLGGNDGALDENNVFVVSSVSDALDEDDMPVKVIRGMWGAAEKEYILDSELSETVINSGDIFRLGFDDSGNVTNMVKVFDYKKQTPEQNGSLTEKYYSYFGYAYDMKGSTLQVALKNPAEVTQTTDLINTFADKMAAIYKYDSKTKKLTTMNYSGIKTYSSNPGGYSKVFAWFYYADHKMMVVYD